MCAGFQIIGNTFWADGQKVDGLSLLDVESSPGKKRCVGEVKAKTSILNLDLSGFENHSGVTTLNSGVQAFAKVSSGYGNGDGRFDGAVVGNVFGTYMHGPILARNPQLADLILTRATGSAFNQISDPLASKYAEIARKY